MMYERSIKLTIESKIDAIALLSEAVQAICSTVISDEVLLYNMKLCLVEATTNVVNHAYHGRPGNVIEVVVTVDDYHIAFQIIDTGDEISIPTSKKELSENTNDVTSLPESGRGLFLINRMMDEVSPSHFEGKNVLTMKKNLQSLIH